MANLQVSEQTPTVSSFQHSASTYISKVKKIAACLMFAFTAQLAVVPAQNSYAGGCIESATKSVITAGVVAASLVIADLLLTGGFFTALALANAGAATVGAGTAAGLLVAKGATVAGAYGCVNASLWDKSSGSSSQSSR